MSTYVFVSAYSISICICICMHVLPFACLCICVCWGKFKKQSKTAGHKSQVKRSEKGLILRFNYRNYSLKHTSNSSALFALKHTHAYTKYLRNRKQKNKSHRYKSVKITEYISRYTQAIRYL